MNYSSKVTYQYIQETQHRDVRYTIEANLKKHPEIMKEFSDWRSKQAVTKIKSFNSLFHPKYKIPMFDIRTAEIREDWGQRNALLDKARYSKILGLAKNFDPMMFEPISVDFIESEKAFIIRDGGGRAHAAIMNGIYSVPATVRKIENMLKQSASMINSYNNWLMKTTLITKLLLIFLQFPVLQNSLCIIHKKAQSHL
jgi:hypothetical protein